MEIFIPSRSRFNDLRTLHTLSGELWKYITIVVPHEQYDTYRRIVPLKIKILKFHGFGIAAKRDFILNLSQNGKIIMFDDDLKFHKRTQDGTRFPGTLQPETEEMIKDIVATLELYPMVGLVDKFMSQTKPRGLIECHRFNQVLGINRDLLPKPWPQFRVPHDEEHDFHLQLLTRGCKTVALTEWSKSDRADAPGGCQDWRSPEILRQVHEKLVELWPSIVTVDTSKDKPKARYNWKEAKRLGGIST